MEHKATSDDNPWIQAFGLFAILGLLASVAAVYFGYRITTEESQIDPPLGPVLIDVGVAVGSAALIAIVLGFAVRAHLWERRNNP